MPNSKRPRSDTKSPIEQDLFVGEAVRRLRNERGLSQSALGEAIGVTFQQVQKYENGRNRVASGRLQQIAGALGVPVSVFFRGEPVGEALPALSARARGMAARYDELDEAAQDAVDAVISSFRKRKSRERG